VGCKRQCEQNISKWPFPIERGDLEKQLSEEKHSGESNIIDEGEENRSKNMLKFSFQQEII
jgi:hypothetical protein